MKIINKQMTFAVIVASRNLFNGALAVKTREKLLKTIDSIGAKAIILDQDQTNFGCIETPSDVAKYVELFKKHKDEIDGIVISLPNFGDEVAVIRTINESGLNVPIIVQADNDDIDKVSVDMRKDAFCGKISVCNNLYQYGYKFTNTSTHTIDVDSEEFIQDLIKFSSICRVKKGLTGARIGAIGARPAGFQTVRFSEKILQQNNITVIPVDLSEILGQTKKYDHNNPQVQENIKSIKEYGVLGSNTTDEKLLKVAIFAVTVNQWIHDNNIDAVTIQCWTSLEENFGIVPCLVMSMLSENLIPSACEVDVCGAISMYALSLSAQQPAGLLDWNNNYGNQSNKCVCTHCSNYPKSFLGTTPKIDENVIIGSTLGRENSWGAISGQVAKGDFTFFRISTDDPKGIIKSYVGNGVFTDDKFEMNGGIAVIQIDNINNLMDYICQNGFEHHVAMVRTNQVEVIEEVMNKYLHWNCYTHT